ncbi:MAG TPA: hypothetical protein VKZ68_06670 [Ohtaekwangia sp.]|nr:hypothetical protein [Ohtaekwangia sp.]
MVIAIAGFLACAALVMLSGAQLSRQGDRLATLTNLSKAWIGFILMSAVTSLPELITGISSAMVVKAPDLAAGNVIGSCAFNLLILSLLDLMVKKPITSLVKSSHIVAGSFGIILVAAMGMAILIGDDAPSLLWFSPFSLLIVLMYLAAIRGVFYFDKRHPDDDSPDQREDDDSPGLKRVILIYAANALVVIGAALFLPYFAEEIAEQGGLSESFAGTVLLAIATSLPEIVVSIAAVRMKSVDLAIGNLLGSNLFNVVILVVIDGFYTEGPLFAALSPTHLTSVFAVIIMTATVAVGLMVRPERQLWRLSMDSLVILLVYVAAMFLLN